MESPQTQKLDSIPFAKYSALRRDGEQRTMQVQTCRHRPRQRRSNAEHKEIWTTVEFSDRNDAPNNLLNTISRNCLYCIEDCPLTRTTAMATRTFCMTERISGCMRPPAASVAPSPAEDRESVLLGKRRLEARCVWRVVVAEHRGFAGRSLGTCGPDLC